MGKVETVLLVAAFATSVMGMHDALDNVSDNSNLDELWEIYKKAFDKTYEPFEDDERMQVFKDSAKFIVEHNVLYAKGESGYSLSINQFADRKPGEYPVG